MSTALADVTALSHRTPIGFGVAGPTMLEAFEHRIIAAMDASVRSKMSVCVAFAVIKQNELYTQQGYESFKEYLKAERVRLHYHTAHEYSKIGEVLIKYEEELAQIRFHEEYGLKKLLLLEQAIEQSGVERAMVFRKLTEASFREFRDFARGTDRVRRDGCNDAQSLSCSRPVDLESTDEFICLRSSGHEIIWFDTDLDECFPTHRISEEFRRYLLHAVKQFFKAIPAAE